MRNAYRPTPATRASQRRGVMTPTARAYLALISMTLDHPPNLTRAQRARMYADLAKPRPDEPRVIDDLFDDPQQGR